MINLNCAICNSSNTILLYKENFDIKSINEDIFSARRIPDHIHYRVVICKNCGLVFSNPILKSELIEKLYKKSKFNYKNFENDLNTTYGKFLNRFIEKIPVKKRLLEIGCGNGFFLGHTRKLGFTDVYGIEPSFDSVNKAPNSIKNHIINDVFKPNQFKKNFFDLICFFQVLDHIIDPNELLKECYRILKPGGAIFCINHDVNGLSVKLFGEKSPIFDVEHIYLFNKNTLEKIFTKNKFKITEVFDVDNYYPLSYWIRMIPIPFKIKNIIEKLFRKLKLNDIKNPRPCVGGFLFRLVRFAFIVWLHPRANARGFRLLGIKFWVKAGNIGIFATK